MFKKLFKGNQGEHLLAPLTGELVAIEKVPDPVFGEKMMGDGLAIKPTEGKVLAPIDCEIVHAPDTKHAIGIKTESGHEILVHIGLETVALKGEGFDFKVKVGDKVEAGDVLIEFDLAFIKANADDSITPIVWTNGQDSDKKISFENVGTSVTAGQTQIMTIQ